MSNLCLAGAELHKLTKEQEERIFVPGQKQAIADKEPGAHAVTAPEDAQQVEETQRKFAANKKGQFDLGFGLECGGQASGDRPSSVLLAAEAD